MTNVLRSMMPMVSLVMRIMITAIDAGAMVVPMSVLGIEEQPGAQKVHAEADDRHDDRLLEADGDRREQADDRLVADQERDQRQDQGARKSSKVAELAGAVREAGIVGVAAGEVVGQGRDAEGGRVGRHVPPVGHERHRPEDRAGDDLGHHHDRRQTDDDPGAPRVAVMTHAEEDMLMLPSLDRLLVHG